MPSPIRKIINKVKNWWNLPPCPRHGQYHLFKHGDGKVECMPCFNEMMEDWQSKREDYLSGK